MNAGFEVVPEPEMSCEDVLDLMHSFVSNELEPEESRPILEHLANCEACRKAMSEHVRLAGKLSEHMPRLGKLYFTAHNRRYD